MFDLRRHSSLNGDEAIIRHELGHAAFWLVNGGALGRLKLERLGNQLGGRIRVGARTPAVEDPDEFFRLTAERLLAGEVAARRHVGLPVNAVSVGPRVPPTAEEHWSPRDVCDSFEDPREDVVRATSIAARQDHWRGWLTERLRSASVTVESHWHAIDEAARELERSLPSRGHSMEYGGGFMIRLLRDSGVDTRLPNDEWDVEALSRKDLPHWSSWPRRLVAALAGRRRWRWTDDDVRLEWLPHEHHRDQARDRNHSQGARAFLTAEDDRSGAVGR